MVEPPVVQEVVLHQCSVKTADIPTGGKILRFVCPNGFTVTIPLNEQGVELVIQRLKGIDIAIARPGML